MPAGNMATILSQWSRRRPLRADTYVGQPTPAHGKPSLKNHQARSPKKQARRTNQEVDEESGAATPAVPVLGLCARAHGAAAPPPEPDDKRANG
jgi:hypothetical protein